MQRITAYYKLFGLWDLRVFLAQSFHLLTSQPNCRIHPAGPSAQVWAGCQTRPGWLWEQQQGTHAGLCLRALHGRNDDHQIPMLRNQREASVQGRWNLHGNGKSTGGQWGTSCKNKCYRYSGCLTMSKSKKARAGLSGRWVSAVREKKWWQMRDCFLLRKELRKYNSFIFSCQR